MAVSKNIIKYTLHVLNTILGIASFISVIFFSNAAANVNKDHLGFLIAGITCGVFVFLVAILGCVGVAKENKKLLYVYGGLIALILLCNIIMTIAYYVDKSHIYDEPDRLWKENQQNPGAMAKLEENFHCCGLTGSQDYKENKKEVPIHCYRQHIIQPDHLYTEGCKTKVTNDLNKIDKLMQINIWLEFVIDTITLILTGTFIYKLRAIQ